jgi:hypothetical protein
MNPERGRIKYDEATAPVMDVGIAQYFTSVATFAVVDAKAVLLKAADSFGAFLSGKGSGSQLASYFDELDVAGIRSAAGWVPEGTKLIGKDLHELFGIATAGNYRPPPGTSESDVYVEFRRTVEAFCGERAVRT